MKILYFLLIFLISSPALAEQHKDITSFATLPVLHEGRLKPMDSLARAKLKLFSGSESLSNFGPDEWLLEVLFDPATASARPIFKIRNPDLLGILSLDKKNLYSFEDLLPKILSRQSIITSILNKPESDWTQSQNDLVKLQQDMANFEQLTSSLSSLLPLNVEILPDAPDYLKNHIGKSITYRDILKFRERLDLDLKKIIKAKGDNISTYTPQEQILAFLSFSANQLGEKGNNNYAFKILPSGTDENWLSPWEILSTKGSPNLSELIALWEALGKSEDINNWNMLIKQINEKSYALGHVSHYRINIEYTYNLLHPHDISLLFYILGLIIICAGSLLHKKALLGISGYTILLGAIIHIFGIAARIYILQRPPVSTLYESILFVGAIIVSYGLGLWFKRRNIIFLIGAGVGGSLLHILSLSHSSEGDSMVMLDAVLNTKFWLATHVLCITTGYGFCLIASAFAHYLLLTKNPQPYLQSSLLNVTLLSLFFATIGTILGGIWADQSWGRFWGWDPKENGAMLIALWLIWIIHGRISGQMNPRAFQAGAAYLSVIVALSWFGVNLLGVGLHSYGFTTSLAFSLVLFVTCETALIFYTWRKKSYET